MVGNDESAPDLPKPSSLDGDHASKSSDMPTPQHPTSTSKAGDLGALAMPDRPVGEYVTAPASERHLRKSTAEMLALSAATTASGRLMREVERMSAATSLAKSFDRAVEDNFGAMRALSKIDELNGWRSKLDALSRAPEIMDASRAFRESHLKVSESLTASIKRSFDVDHLAKSRADIGALALRSSEIARITQWSTLLGRGTVPDLAKLYPAQSSLGSQLAELHRQALLAPRSNVDALAVLSASRAWSDALSVTSLKLSVMAGVGDVFGLGSRSGAEAYAALLGRWHVRPDMPDRFWAERPERRRIYEELDVDAGLAEASPAEAVEVMIASGLAAGTFGGQSSVASFAVGDITVNLGVGNTEAQAAHLVRATEQRLRVFIAEKMEAKYGPKWFSQRTPPTLSSKAKGARAAALKAGETETRIVAFTDIGDLEGVVTRTDNWGEVFENIFRNRETFKQHMNALNTWRRPTAHSRKVDAVMLLELICACWRLIEHIDDDGAWKVAAEAEF